LVRLTKNRLAWKLLPVCLAAAGLGLSGCESPYPQSTSFNTGLPSGPVQLPPPPGGTAAPAGTTGKTSGAVALLVPLTGDLAPVGQALENAAKLAFPAGDGPGLDVRDTAGTAAGATAAAQAAIANGDGLILGPLTSGEAHAVAPIAQAANVNVLAFTNDSTVAAPGIWALGISPDQQVKRVIAAAAADGRTQVAALLPDTNFGHALGTSLQSATASLGEPGPNITFYDDGFSALNQAAKDVSDFADRGAGLEAQIKAAKEQNNAAGREKARELEHQQIPAPNFNALFIGAISGNELAEMATLLPFYAVAQPQVQFLGPANWAGIAQALGQNGVYNGALYAATDPQAAAEFDQKYAAAYGAPPPAIADVAFDSAAIAHLLAGQGGFTSNLLTNPSGFTGADGLVQLNPDGTVQRALAVFEVSPTGPTVTSPAPSSLTTPSS
jgi:ABC-type branched-subunit amino acid transport system substrate-binding protein